LLIIGFNDQKENIAIDDKQRLAIGGNIGFALLEHSSYWYRIEA